MAECGVTRLLLPLDGSPLAEQALGYAPLLVRPPAEVSLLRVVPMASPLRQSLLADAHDYLAHVAQGLQNAWPGLHVAPIVTVGDPGDEILQLVRTRRIDLTVMASRTPRAIGRLTLGSVTDDVARRGHGPVVIVRQRDVPSAFRRLVIPLDGSTRATRTLPVAASVAQRLGLPVHLLTVAAAGAEVASWLETAAAAVRRAGVVATWAVVGGDPGWAISDAARPGDLIVAAHRDRGGLARWRLGSVTEHLIRQGPVPVMLIRGTASLVPAGQEG